MSSCKLVSVLNHLNHLNHKTHKKHKKNHNDHNNHNNQAVYPQECSLFCESPVSRWTLAGSPEQELRSGESRDDCARAGDTSSSRSLRPWPRSSTTLPYVDRRRPGPWRRITRCTSRRRSGRILLPWRQALSTFPWTSKMCLPPAPGQTGCLPCLDRRSGVLRAHRGADG